VLIDTGFGLRDVRHARQRLSRFFRTLNGIRLDEAETALRQIERLGFSAGDVRHIVLTHLDFDHAGGVEDFPGAAVHLLEAEWQAATAGRHGFIATRRYRPAQWDAGIDWRRYRPGGEGWFGFDAARGLDGLPPEILLVPLPGHTPGHCGVAVRANGDWRLLAGDAYFDLREMQPNPRCTPGLRLYQRMMETDRTARLANQARLRALARAETGAIDLFCSHDATELLRHAAAPA
jgi:glyoxylase-like metal-dependent hydrolase (beta-lactamase superfamily II)